MNILINVVNQKLKIVKNINNLISGTQEFIRFKFFLDNDWDNLTIFAQFIQNGTPYNKYLDSDRTVCLPAEICPGEFHLLLYGTGGDVIATTNYLTIDVDENILMSNASSTDISRSLYQQLVDVVSANNTSINNQIAINANNIDALSAQLASIIAEHTPVSDTEIYDARISHDGTEYDTVGQHIRAVTGGNSNRLTSIESEIADARVGADGVTYTNIGAHIRNVIVSAETEIAALENQIDELETALENVSIDPDDLGLYYDETTSYLYPTYKDTVSANGIFAQFGGGGGGGGGDTVDAVLTVTNTTGWLSKTIASGAECTLSFTWSSIENEMPTGDGSISITVNNVLKSTYNIKQGDITVDISSLVSTGSNKVKIRISDTYDQGKTITFNITVVAISISSTFDTSIVYTTAFSFPFIPVGSVEKTIYFYLDGSLLGTQTTTVSGRQLSFAIPAQTHGAHTLRVYFESEINAETVRSNELYYEFIYAVPGNTTTIITSQFNKTEQQQFSSIVIPFTVYNPSSLSSDVEIYANNTLVSSQTVDRTEQSYTYRASDAGTLAIGITSGGTTKTITINITEVDIDVEAETEDLVLYLSSYGRSNSEDNPASWSYENISCTFTNFNWASDGWQTDSDGVTVMRVSGDARLTIPYKPFASDFRTTGKTIEIEFATRNVLNYDSTILSCMNDGRGIAITSQRAYLNSEQSSISTQYKEEEHVRIAFVAEKRADNRLLYIYINGIASGVVQYPVDDDFSQSSPVNISVGSNDCTIDIYCIRIYDNNLTRYQILDNWIADTQDGATMLDRYNHNNVYDEYGNIVISALPSDLPYMIIECAELPQYKGDKKTCSGSYVNPMDSTKNFTFTGAEFDVQGTSSQYYPRKNYKAKFKNGFVMSSGNTISKYAMNTDAIPVNTFCFKADVASSEGANNVELVRLYNSACPYLTPAQIENSKVRQGIDGFPMVIFWANTSTGDTSFIGKYNFNNDKSTEDVFGFVNGDESWEILNNTGNRVIWKSNDYSGTEWLNDFEARYPDIKPPYTDPTQLSELATWVMSTDTTAATNNTLDEPVTYDETTYTTDSAEYRLAKFKAEASDYLELDSTLFYYLFTELFLMVDSRAKNAFPSFIGTEVSA